MTDYTGSHMPLDTETHWNWRNPLNMLPALVLLAFVLALLGCFVQLV